MAVENEVKYSKSVPDVRSGGSIPIVEKKESVQQVGTPAIGEAFREYGKADNFLSTIGNSIASTASNAIAAKLGGDYGQNPKGSLLPLMNEFDKTFKQNYTAQAHAQLGLQANKLITDSNIELSNATYLTPEMIEKNQHQIAVGLQNIYKQAPDEVRPNLELQYGAIQQEQKTMLHNRLLKESHEQQHNTTMRFSSDNARDAYSLALSGNDKAAESAQSATEQINTINTKVNHGDPLVAEANVKAVRIARLQGRYIRMGLEAQKDGKLAEYLKSLDSPPADVSPGDYESVAHGVYGYFNNQQAMRSQYENLQSANMHNRIAKDPVTISDPEWAEYEKSVSPIKAAEMKFNLIQALKSKHEETAGVQGLVGNWASPEAHANATEKVRNAGFNQQVQYAQTNNGLSHEEAQVQVAASAGAAIPVYTQQLKNQLWSGDPAQMGSAASMIQELQDMSNGHALTGLSDQDKALFSDFKHNYNPADPASSARMVIENSQNIDPQVKKITEQLWTDKIFNGTKKNGVDVGQYILNKFGFQGGLFHSKFDSPYMATVYAADIEDAYHTNFINSRGADDRATELTQQYINENYGKTAINGDKAWTLHPIEKFCGFAEGDGIQAIHSDFQRQMAAPLARLKEAYDNHQSDEFWTVETNYKPLSYSEVSLSKGLPNESAPLQMIKHTRNGISQDTKTFPVVLVGTNFDRWEVNVQTEHGPRSVFLEAPKLGTTTYTPDKKWVQDQNAGRSHTFPTEKYSSQLRSRLMPNQQEGA